MNSFNRVRAALLLVLVIQSFHAAAQSPVTADLVEDRSYISPGGQTTLVVEITNPADSGEEIVRATGGGYGFNLGRQYVDVEADAPCGQFLCPVDPSQGFPLPPGSSARFYHRSLQVSADAPAGLLIRVDNIRLALLNSASRQLNDVHLQHDFVAIVAPDGQGDPAHLNALDTANPRAGSADIDATLALHYPDTVAAGSHIEVTGTLRNHGSEPITSYFILGSHRHLGNHTGSFRQIFCRFKCLYNGEFPLYRGDSIDVLFRQMYYEDDLLFSGDLQIRGPHAIVRDSMNRTAYVYADDIDIRITHDGDEPGPAVYPPMPEREPLALTTSRDPSQRAVVYDPNTGKSWIPLPETQGMSFAQVLAETDRGGRFEGYSIADSEEVTTLFLNHIYASGLDHPEYALFGSSQDLYAVSGALLDLIGETPASMHVGGTVRYGRGMVADVPEPGGQSVTMDIRQNNADIRPFGMTGGFWIDSFYASQYEGMATWLVKDAVGRGAVALHDSAGADFRYGRLSISSADVEGHNYTASFRVIDKDELILELVSLVDEFSREPAATYDAATQTLRVPRLRYFAFPDDHVHFDVRLRLIPATDPPQFRVISAEPVVE